MTAASPVTISRSDAGSGVDERLTPLCGTLPPPTTPAGGPGSVLGLPPAIAEIGVV
jgi:hypothetical protein